MSPSPGGRKTSLGAAMRRALPLRWGLREKLLALYTVSGLAVLLVAATFYARSLADGIERQYYAQAVSIWQVFDAAFPSPEDLRGPLVEDRLGRLRELNPELHAIHVYAPVDGRFLVVASTDATLVGGAASVDDLQPIIQDRPIWREFSHGGEMVAEVGAPLHAAGRPVGVLGLYFRLSFRDALIREQLTTFLAVSVAGGGLLLALLYWELERVVLRPLFRLKLQAEAVRRGDLSARTSLGRPDEVGQVAASLDSMAASLEERQEENARLQTELRQRYEAAKQQALRAPITGLYNHRYFFERLSEEIGRARRFAEPVSLLFCDIDRFKSINDAHGHQAGDEVLRAVARELRASTRAIDVLAQYGGEEFTVILPKTDRLGALQVAERIRLHVGSSSARPEAGSAPAATVSIGIACFPEDASEPPELVHRADRAMYHAKQLGRNQVRTYAELERLAEEGGIPDWGKDSLYFEAVQSLAAAVDARDRYTHSHSDSVAHFATTLARALGMGGVSLVHLQLGALLHDVGKIGIADQVLGKNGDLSPEDWQKMREHPVVGKAIVQHVKAYAAVVPLILHHHERWDGGGYPDGLAGEQIPLGARIITVVDAYHAMTSDRPYRRALSREEALRELRRHSGTQFDPDVVEAFMGIPEEALCCEEVSEPPAETVLVAATA